MLSLIRLSSAMLVHPTDKVELFDIFVSSNSFTRTVYIKVLEKKFKGF